MAFLMTFFASTDNFGEEDDRPHKGFKQSRPMNLVIVRSLVFIVLLWLSPFGFYGKQHCGPSNIFASLSSIRTILVGDWPPERLVHVVERLQCRAHSENGVAMWVSRSFIIGNQFLVCGDGISVEGLPNFKDLEIDIFSK
ncbi:Mitogen-activated protein kinase kinase 3 [Spatholobus suberectus]|nr:Mitogen-activated protein kinase kinase 3 [Spatholobus suberectus]